MTVNIIKLCVGADSIEDLEKWQKGHYRLQKHAMHVTRQWPKRAGEVLDGGSIYWVINGFVCVRQRIVDLKEVDKNRIPSCGLVLDKNWCASNRGRAGRFRDGGISRLKMRQRIL